MAQVGPNVASEYESKRSALERTTDTFISLIDSKYHLDQMIHQKYLEMCMGSNLQSGHESQRFLENNTDKLKSLIVRISRQLWEIIQLEHPSMCMDPNLQAQYKSKRSALEINKKEFISLIDRKDPLEQIIQQEMVKCMAQIGPDFEEGYQMQRSALEFTKEEFISLIDRKDQRDQITQQQNLAMCIPPEGISLLSEYKSDRSVMEKTKMQLKELFERLDVLDQKNQRRLEIMAQVGIPLHSEDESTSSKQSASSSFLHQLRQWFPVWKSTGSQSKRSNPKQEKDEQLKLLESIAIMQATNARISNELENTKKEFESFKDRVAEEVCLSIKSENTVCMNNPLSKIRLKEMYDELSSQWPKIKEHLRSNTKSKTVQSLIKVAFEEAQRDMEEKRKALNKVFELNELSWGPIPQKIEECKQSTIMNLQLLLFYSRKNEGSLKTFLSGQKTCEDVQHYLHSECYWLGCLMALNNPALLPDWKNHYSDMDPWNIFPQHFESRSAV